MEGCHNAMRNRLSIISIVVAIITAIAAIAIAYHLQKPYVRVVKLFINGQVTRTHYKLKNAGPATAISLVLADHFGNPVEMDIRLGQRVTNIDALGPGQRDAN
jgi:hypothetical protein